MDMKKLGFLMTYFAFLCATLATVSGDTSSFKFPYIQPDPYPVIVQIPEGAINNFTKVGSSTNNSFALVYATIPAGAGPPPHIHHWTDEWFYFPEGGIIMYSSEDKYPDPLKIPNGIQLPKAKMHRYQTKPGDLVYGPAFYVHGFRNEGNVSRKIYLIWTPDKLSQYFFEVGQIVTDPCKMPPIDDINKDRFVSEAPRYGMNMSSYWDEYVASWDDNWQPTLGMDAQGQRLLDLLTASSAQPSPCTSPKSHMLPLQPSSVFIFLINIIIIIGWSIFI